MPGIKIVRKNRLKSIKSTSSENVVEVQHSQQDTPSLQISTPGKQDTNESWDKVGTYYHNNIDQNRKGNQRIFVQIAAYRDPELIPTIKDMIERADNPENLRFGICWQYHPDDEYNDDMFEFMNDDRFQIIKVDARRGHGTCWARHSLQHLWCEDEFTLAIDSHHRFVDHWDSEMKSMYYYMQDQGHEKPLFTGYITSYKPWLENKDGTGERNLGNGFEVDPWKMIIDRFIPEGAMFFLPTSMERDEQREPIPSRFYSAHFAFASGKMCKEVPHDPNYYFHGEEISIAVRAYTHGYDLFHPHKIIAYHEYTRKGRPHHWDDNNKSSGREYDWYEVNDQCHKRNRILFGMDGEDPNQINFGDEYGFGKVRSVEQFEEYAGINFKQRAISPDCRDYKTPSYENIIPHDQTEWCKNWCIDFFVPWDELPETYEDTEFWYVGVHDAEGKELKREDYDLGKIQEIYDERQDPYAARFPMSLTCPETPASYTVIPYTHNDGWLDKITKDIVDPK